MGVASNLDYQSYGKTADGNDEQTLVAPEKAEETNEEKTKE